jgi:hypothetical protein
MSPRGAKLNCILLICPGVVGVEFPFFSIELMNHCLKDYLLISATI